MAMMPTSTSLIRRVRDPRDAESWREFVELYEPLLWSYVRSKNLSDSDTRDVVQEVFLSLLRALPTFNLDHSRGRFRTWLWQVTMNGIAEHFRKQKRHDKAKDAFQEVAPVAAPPSDQPDPDWEKAHRQRVLEFVLPKVKAKTQEKTWWCFEQHVLKNRPGTELAKEAGISANAVCVNAARVLAKVREMAAEYSEDDDAPQEET